MPKARTQKETIEYDAKFLEEWGRFCDSKGYVMRSASHAARIAFMGLTPAQREQVMQEAMAYVVASRQRHKR